MSGRKTGATRYPNNPWPAGDAQLTRLWMAQPIISAAQIGKIMHLTKGQIIGRAHRISLPARPSCIRANPTSRTSREKAHRLVMDARALPPLALNLPKLVEEPTPERVAIRLVPRASHACAWPFGHPKDPGFHFCDGASLPGKPYCPTHHAVAYRVVKQAEAA